MRKSTLNEMMEFDCVIRVNPDLSIDTHPEPHVYAPESVIDVDENEQIMPESEKLWLESLKSQGWEPLNGYSGQYGYSGPIMHASEFIGGYLEEYILDHPGLYVVTSVECLAAVVCTECGQEAWTSAEGTAHHWDDTIDDIDHDADADHVAIISENTYDEPAGWVVLYREIELPHVGYRCPCCGDDVVGTQPICADCESADCERSQRGGNDRAWYNCQRSDTEGE